MKALKQETIQTKIEKISAVSALVLREIPAALETETSFLSFRERLSLANITHPLKQREWVAARMAVKESLDALGLVYPGFYKDRHGKSHSMNGIGYVSLSHTERFAAAIYHQEMPVGIDIDHVREKTLRLGPKFLSDKELEFLPKDPLHYTLAWSAKETIFKCQGRKGISLREHILLDPFPVDAPFIYGQIHHTDHSNHFYKVKPYVQNDLVMTYTVW
ncbi:4'-phosphopantetheinyl transferase [Nitritalea halalkaliphila LW7]|uniref:4'-phosphopantetheinyl transferase n=1 Tax=Nitritalea halalkaliphila LW7 TaxID=1189621 RepID=I5C3I2_9BACT|nr:4'-phosphopantetheinyl transferase superfamily protein [Nitritalea halalkaliphila]EIM76384.1 4'-phosphopantetheinyl transferase [Nitritalea halalkaliphila LW7]